ncbi:MAG: DUF5682 family protein [Bacteroidia bacterium]
MHKVFGIRHHGPGSARRLKAALEAYEPDILLVEGPPEGDQLLAYLDDSSLQAPVAMLVYDPKAPNQASFYPFAEFSPEWIAMHYARQNGIPFRFNDLSLGNQWSESSVPRREQQSLNPLGLIAEAAGFPNGESWWDAKVENLGDSEDHFEAILNLMGEARKLATRNQAPNIPNLRREAMMRKYIRAAIKEGFERIAVVCGAFHAPVLEKLPPAKNDNALLKGMKRKKMQATWIPWTYERLAFSSGYGAGVHSPAWYELIFHYPAGERSERWLSQAAQLLRGEGLNTSSAQVIDAVNLAQNLAIIRGQREVSLAELQESLISVFDEGSEDRLAWIHQKLIVGDKMGQIPNNSPAFPLQKDIQLKQKSFRLKVLAEPKTITLDLRKDFDREKSIFLHRLKILGIQWATSQKVTKHEGTFREIWELIWKPASELQIVEAATWGNTVEQACDALVKQKLEQGLSIIELAAWLENVFLADLKEIFPLLIQKLSAQTNLADQVAPLLQVIPPLVSIFRYGDVRENQSYDIVQLLMELVPRVCIGLADACRQLDDDLAESRFEEIQEAHSAMSLLATLSEEKLDRLWIQWQNQLDYVVRQGRIHPRIDGFMVRILFDNQRWDADEVAIKMSQILSPGTDHQEAAKWIEGLLYGSGLLLIHYPPLFQLIDQWLSEMKEAQFQDHLALLRRTFARFSHAERRQMGEIAKVGLTEKADNETQELNPERVAMVRPIFETLLGIGKN